MQDWSAGCGRGGSGTCHWDPLQPTNGPVPSHFSQVAMQCCLCSQGPQCHSAPNNYRWTLRENRTDKGSRKEAAQGQWELQEQLNHANGKESKKGRNMPLQPCFSEADSSSSGRVKSTPLIKKPADPVISAESAIKGAGDGFMHSAWEMLPDGSVHNMQMARANSSIPDEQQNLLSYHSHTHHLALKHCSMDQPWQC